MESYIEIAWIINYLICWHSYQLGFAYTSLYVTTCKKIFLALLTSIISVFSFYPYSGFVILTYETSLLIYHRNQMKAIFLADWFRFMWNMSFLVIHSGTLRYTAYFSNLQFPYELVMVLLIWLGIELLTQSHKIHRQQFYVDIKIENKWLKGYYDSGNLMMIHQLPCVFIKREIYEKISSQTELCSKMHTMNQQTVVKGKVSELMYRNKERQKVILIPADQKLPGNCDCLLNMKNQGGKYVD